jgi:phosphonate transport system permease protein
MTPCHPPMPPALRDPAWQSGCSGRGRLVLLWPLLVATEFKPWVLFDADSLKVTASSWPGSCHRRIGRIPGQVARETWRTVAIATAGMTLALVLAVPLTLLAACVLSVSALGGRMARGRSGCARAVRWLLIVLRSVPELVWALVFVRVVGLGPTAGVLAIALTYGGMLGKVYAEILESGEAMPRRRCCATAAAGCRPSSTACCRNNAAELTSYTVYRWECAIRSRWCWALSAPAAWASRWTAR